MLRFVTRSDWEPTAIKPLRNTVRPDPVAKVRKRSLQKHLRFPCGHCDVVYNRKDNLVTHMKKKHNIVLPGRTPGLAAEEDHGPPYKCNLCSSQYNRRDNLVAHKKKKHTTEM